MRPSDYRGFVGVPDNSFMGEGENYIVFVSNIEGTEHDDGSSNNGMVDVIYTDGSEFFRLFPQQKGAYRYVRRYFPEELPDPEEFPRRFLRFIER